MTPEFLGLVSKNTTTVQRFNDIVPEQFTAMPTESTVIALLQSSVTGAGLVLAVYALVLPYASKILRARANILEHKISALQEAASSTSLKVSDAQIARIKKLTTDIEATKNFPSHLSAFGIGLAFLLYSLCSLMSLWWLLNWNKDLFDTLLPIGFGIATAAFLVIGLYSIYDIHSLLVQEFESLKVEHA